MIPPEQLVELQLIADKLEKLGNDLLEAGVPGFGLSIRKEATKLRVLAEVLE